MTPTTSPLLSANSVSIIQALEYCPDILKMKQHFGFMVRTTSNVPLAIYTTGINP
jgi:hypothetical protein